jgi:carbon storage regulator CsrA
MALVLTRRPGEAILVRRVGLDGVLRTVRLFIISVDGNVVRLSLEAPPEVAIIREELLLE